MSFWRGLSVIVVLGVAYLVLFPAVALNHERQQRSAHARKVLLRCAVGVRPGKGGIVLSILPRSKRDFRLTQTGREGNELNWSSEMGDMSSHYHKPVSLQLSRGSAFAFNSRHWSCRFGVQAIEKSGVRFKILNSSSWFSPDKTVFLPWKPTQGSA